jgi:small subunit ribosomal protein S4e
MAQKGPKKGLKRSKAPKLWKIARKEKKWTINPVCGPHNKEAIPLAFIIRDFLGYARTLREAKYILNERKVMVNGAVRTDYRFPVGLMDVVEIPSTEQYFRILPNRKGQLILHPISPEEAQIRPLKITDKHLIHSGVFQLRFHDGATLQVSPTGDREKKGAGGKGDMPAAEGKKKDKAFQFKRLGTVLFNVRSSDIVDYFSFEKHNYAMITRGRNVSKAGTITSIKEDMVEIEAEEKVRTLKENVFVIGKRESIISLPGD